MKPIILLTGKTGQLGCELARLLPKVGRVSAPDHQEMNLLNPGEIRKLVQEFRPQLIINAAAYTAVDAAETDEATARAVNAEAPRVLAEEAAKLGALLVHYSTDYVFDGTKKSPYIETDLTNPLNVYGQTKLAGELAIQASGASHLIFRTSWLYATHGKNFLLTILRLATQRDELKIVSDQTGSPTCASEIAKATSEILSNAFQSSDGVASASMSGVYHMTAGGQATWHDFATAILEYGADVTAPLIWLEHATQGRPVIAKRIIPTSTQAYESPTRRPAYSVLSNLRLNETFQVALGDWRVQLKSLFSPETQAAAVSRNGS
jgi:dTDP-4-dehydrorhamnose reductase